jgi:hypothetical protein
MVVTSECLAASNIRWSTFMFYLVLISGCISFGNKDKPSNNLNNEKVIFQKVYYDGRKLLIDTDRIVDPIHIINVLSVLTFYGNPTEVDDSLNILVKKTMYEDMNYVYNMTLKSEDSVWLKKNVWTTNKIF